MEIESKLKELQIKKEEQCESWYKLGFKAGQLAEKERCLKIIREFKKKFEKRYYGWGDLPLWIKEFEELTKKVTETKETK